jgi:pimeloyl-ACP methyl ester carboxylesterase
MTFSALDSELLGPLFATLTTRDDLETKPRLAAPGLRDEYVASDQWVRWWRNIWMRRLGKSLDVLPGLVGGSDRPSITRRVAVLLPKSLVGCIIFGLGPRVQGNRPMEVVLLPGLLCDATVWSAQVAALKPHANVTVADFSQLDSLEDMARASLALRTSPLVAIGHSMGARVALEMVRAAPERIARLALLDTGIHPVREGEEANRQILVDLAFKDGMAALAARWLPPMVHEARVGNRRLMEPLKAMVMRATPEQHLRQIRALLNRPDPRALLPTIRCPVLVMVGRQDRWSPLAQHQEIAALIPNAELVVIEDSGHMSPVEQADQVSRALLRWLGLEEKTQAPLGAATSR